ncbi:FAD-dependent 5-carboxymethylaminomethyl-2-thiouridine(34) oxidoreductase MnmC [Leptothrix discophora]|uniref:FAD-dependent 5-carboxymethylaminomethyl-2-thiouridine(34) oxidoreductase MnmC n=1 Tax=Leptothrix discophora TaxID=89 RepID=A0ABT9G170_LEPDI|nr:FAD-dependent 5-carboxymethylaminomethyl-2-thiouridine(34) oxidoreductase MnmC [Leptothrix discophora]MDP4300229.1 FAD-dependent 5-carboxymethylaminomethyl-2-thiouridine(34) oxidoreductase MnmC [Leptothrix discophora]
MKRSTHITPITPITPARTQPRDDGLPFPDAFGGLDPTALGAQALAQAQAQAQAQARHVFLGGNGLPGRWAGQARHVVLDTGFGLGHRFLATWDAWRRDPQRCDRLVYVALDRHPPTAQDLASGLRDSPWPERVAQLVAAWPPASPDLQGIDVEAGRVQLLLAWGDLAEVLDGLHLRFDTLYLDGSAAACLPAVRDADICRRIARLAAPGAHLATRSVDPGLRDELARQGFETTQRPGIGDQAEITVGCHRPRFQPPVPRGWHTPTAAPGRDALVIGAGLAGAAAAWGLARAGWCPTVLDRHAQPAQEASGNAGGLVHAIFNAPDSLHARWFRAAALATAQAAGPALARGELAGSLEGFLRLEPRLADDRARQQRDAVGLPPALVDWSDARQAAALSGLPLASGAWLFEHAAGWLDPAGWTRWMLAQAGVDAATSTRWIGARQVERLVPPTSDDEGWTALGADGAVIARAPVVVLANALDATRLLPAGALRPRLSSVRGQVTRLPADLPGLRRPTLPLSGQGYGLTLPGGEVLVGATTQHEAPDDAGRTLRLDDQRHNLCRAAALGIVPPGLDGDADPDAPLLPGRAGWRAVTPDRLPLVGPVVDGIERARLLAAGRTRLDGPRHQPRLVGPAHGLYLCTGLGSRGITSALLAGRVLAAWVGGEPMPVEAALRDALDPARDLG